MSYADFEINQKSENLGKSSESITQSAILLVPDEGPWVINVADGNYN